MKEISGFDFDDNIIGKANHRILQKMIIETGDEELFSAWQDFIVNVNRIYKNDLRTKVWGLASDILRDNLPDEREFILDLEYKIKQFIEDCYDADILMKRIYWEEFCLFVRRRIFDCLEPMGGKNGV